MSKSPAINRATPALVYISTDNYPFGKLALLSFEIACKQQSLNNKWGLDETPEDCCCSFRGNGSGVSPLNADDLLQGVNDFDEVALGGHDSVDVLVGAGSFVNNAPVLPAFNPFRGLPVIGKGKGFLRRSP